MNDIIGTEDAAALLQVEPRTIKEWARDGKVPATKVGRRWLYSRAQLREWVEARARTEQAVRGAK
jgi:excisionase family DNA binding protein